MCPPRAACRSCGRSGAVETEAPNDGANSEGVRLPSGSAPSNGRKKVRVLRGFLALAALTLVASCAACSPVYLVRAGIAEVSILRARQPITRVLNDSTVDATTRGKLSYVLEARRFVALELGIDVGDSYTTYTELDRDTLALVLSAAPKDRLAA